MSKHDATEEQAVVVPLLGSGSSITCLRSLGRRGIPTIGIGSETPPPLLSSKYCSESFQVPPAEDFDGYRRAISRLARRPDVFTFAPLRESDIFILSKYRSELADHIATPWPAFETVRTAQDRLALYEAAERVNIAVPRTRPLDEWDEWSDITVIKPRYSIQVDNGMFLEGAVEIMGPGERPSDREHYTKEMGHIPIAQSYITGEQEHGFFALCDNGEPIVTFQHRRVRSYTYAGGASSYRVSVDIPALEAAGSRLLRELDWHGPAMVEFKYDPQQGKFFLLEVNPRFWGSLALAKAAGIDFPYNYYQLATGEIARPATGHETGVGCHLLQGEVSYLHSVLLDEYSHLATPDLTTTLCDIARSIVAQPNFDYLSVEDPGPFVYNMATAGTDLLKSIMPNLVQEN